MKKYTVDFLTINSPQYVKSGCNSITFWAYAPEGVAVINNSIKLYNYQSLSIDGNENEIDETIYFITGENLFFESGGYVTVIRKNYI
jgi:hypothetical protein